jgi:hypothetical protein
MYVSFVTGMRGTGIDSRKGVNPHAKIHNSVSWILNILLFEYLPMDWHDIGVSDEEND